MTDVLATALAAERAIVRRAVTGARDIDGGSAALDGGWAVLDGGLAVLVRHPPLPDVWHLNRVHLTGRLDRVDGSWLEALLARELAGTGVPHRRVTVDDAGAADAVWPALEDRGWRRERSVVMVRHGAGSDVEMEITAAASVIGGATLAAFQQLAFADDAGVGAAGRTVLPARLAEAQAVLRAGTEWRAFGAGPAADDAPASTATLYLDSDVDGCRVAFVDQLATLRSHREQGLARAVMAAALAAAEDWRADLVALFAGADDWPQVFYASLGFETVGRQTVFHRDL